MIIDSHAHYSNNAYAQRFRYLTRKQLNAFAKAPGVIASVKSVWTITISARSNIGRNSIGGSLRLPAAAEKIAARKGVPPQEVERATTKNTIRLFHLPIDRQDIQDF